MSDREARKDLLAELAVDAPMRRMRARLEEAIDEHARRRARPAGWLVWAAAVTVVVAAAVMLRPRSSAPGRSDAGVRVVLEMLAAPSAFDRLRGVNAAAEMQEAWPAVSAALLERLETDESVNVRLSALDALVGRRLPPRQSARLAAALPGQPAAILQAHLGHRLRRRGLVTRLELERLLAHEGVQAAARDALMRLEES